jgi:hypothetical protein
MREIKCKHKRQVQTVDEQKESREAECYQSIAHLVHCEATIQFEAEAETLSERTCKHKRQIQSTKRKRSQQMNRMHSVNSYHRSHHSVRSESGANTEGDTKDR